jgi:hypothetical protein
VGDVKRQGKGRCKHCGRVIECRGGVWLHMPGWNQSCVMAFSLPLAEPVEPGEVADEDRADAVAQRCYCGRDVAGPLIEHIRAEHPADCIGECYRCHELADLSAGDWAYCRACVAAMKAAGQ